MIFLLTSVTMMVAMLISVAVMIIEENAAKKRRVEPARFGLYRPINKL